MPGRRGSSGAGEPGPLIRYVIPFFVAIATGAVGLVLIVTAVAGAAPGHGGTCLLHVGAAVSGDAGFFFTEVAPGCAGLSVAEAHDAVRADFGFALLYGVAGTLLLRWLWPRAWRIARWRRDLAWLAFLPGAAAVADVIENGFVLWALRSDELALSDAGAVAAGIAGWWKWMLVALALGVVVATMAAALAHLRTPQPPARETGHVVAPRVRDVTGICLSGGGIRSASFSTGALRALDRKKVFGRARWITAVSGGAYAAGAWYIARGTPPPAPARHVDTGALDPKLYDYIRHNRRYLATGRGGIAANALVGLLLIAFNGAVIAALVFVVAWPVGWFASSWVVQPDLRTFDYARVDLQSLWVEPRLWRPGLAGLGLALLPAVASLALWDEHRRVAFRVSAVLAGGGVVLLAALVAVPVAIAEFPKLLVDLPVRGVNPGAGVLMAAVAGAIAIAVAVVLLRPLARRAMRLGGVLLGLLALLFAGKVATDAAYGVGPFAWSPREYAYAAGAAAVFGALANPQAWSLFRLYYLRLRSTFATTRDERRRARGAPGREGVYPLSLRAEPEWPEYQGQPAPKLLVCAAAQRNSDEVTGVRAVTFTFSDDFVGMTRPRWDETETSTATVDERVPAADYVERLRHPWWGPRLGSVSASVAMSGAAFTSAMGRASVGTTNALLAALNVRLGVWMPNPRYPQSSRWKRPGMSYLLKEIFGVYDLDDPYVYVTDGGHWENLGLVELVRRRCKWIYCVDASGDAPGSFQTLEEARVMARVECGAEVDIDVTPLVAPERGLPERSVAVGVVRYHTCGETGPDGCDAGLLFYGRAMVAQDSPINTLSFSLRNRIYPRYPTYDQFLALDDFDNLVRLGESIGRRLGIEHDRLMDALAGGNGDGVSDSPALFEMYERLRGTYDPAKHR
ncbi:MAG: patatin-like phospholipase family protein [Actinomycetota bacterium]|nr:patatin-like phospholipase family protein [Actinomycetota bacterium]